MGESIYSIWCNNSLSKAQREILSLNKIDRAYFKVPETEEEAIKLFESQSIISSLLHIIENNYIPGLAYQCKIQEEELENIKSGISSSTTVEIQQSITDMQTMLYIKCRNQYIKLKEYLKNKERRD